jgi:hypothetical protein
MKQLHFLSLLSALLITVFLGCGSSSDPENIVKDFFEAVESGDANAATEMLSSQIIEMLGKEKLKSAIEEQSKEIKTKGGISNIEFKDKVETENSITMNVIITYGDGSINPEKTMLVLEEGEWKLGIAK